MPHDCRHRERQRASQAQLPARSASQPTAVGCFGMERSQVQIHPLRRRTSPRSHEGSGLPCEAVVSVRAVENDVTQESYTSEAYRGEGVELTTWPTSSRLRQAPCSQCRAADFSAIGGLTRPATQAGSTTNSRATSATSTCSWTLTTSRRAEQLSAGARRGTGRVRAARPHRAELAGPSPVRPTPAGRP